MIESLDIRSSGRIDRVLDLFFENRKALCYIQETNLLTFYFVDTPSAIKLVAPLGVEAIIPLIISWVREQKVLIGEEETLGSHIKYGGYNSFSVKAVAVDCSK